MINLPLRLNIALKRREWFFISPVKLRGSDRLKHATRPIPGHELFAHARKFDQLLLGK